MEIEAIITILNRLEEKVDRQGERISDLCTRSALAEEKISDIVDEKVKVYKIITIILTSVSGVLTGWTQIKSFFGH